MVMEESTIHSSSPVDDGTNSNSNVYLVGLEFVRQYYTVLNQGPLYLHRFYSEDSSFVHGVSARDSKVVYGQQEIHKRIQALNFHNCHAKIKQVDSHETLGNGVVIQVTGELSNNGQPMRRFMQTFVLAPQSPKRYYVRNDIFHYQDEIFGDEESESELQVESNLDDQEDVDDNEKDIDINGGNGLMQMESESPVEPVIPVAKLSPVLPDTCENSEDVPQGQKTPNVTADVVPKKEPKGAGTSPQKEEEARPPLISPEPVESSTSAPSSTDPPLVPATEEETPATTNSNAGAKTFTYANLLKSGAAGKPPPPRPPTGHSMAAKNNQGHSAVSVNVNEGALTSPPQVSPQAGYGGGSNRKMPPRPRNSGYNRDRDRDGRDRGNDNRGDRDRPSMDRDRERDNRDRRERLSSRSSNALNDDTGSNDGDRRRPVNTYPDANQLFVGNLPHFVTVQDMKDIFSAFGEVAEVKIQKPAPKSSNVKVPYFCFVVFEDPSSAQAAIDKKSEIFMKLNGGGQRRLNVEPKRSQRQTRTQSYNKPQGNYK